MTERRKVRTVAQPRGRQRRDALLRAALELVNEGGLRAVTHRSVSVRAGFSPATAGNYFPSVRDLIEHTLRLHIEQRAEQLAGVLQRVSTEATSLKDLGLRLATALVSGESGVAAAQYEVYLEASRNPELRAVVAESMSTFEHLAAPLLAGLGVQHPLHAARSFLAVLDGLAIHRLSNPLPVEEDIQHTLHAIAGALISSIFTIDELLQMMHRTTPVIWPPRPGTEPPASSP